VDAAKLAILLVFFGQISALVESRLTKKIRMKMVVRNIFFLLVC